MTLTDPNPVFKVTAFLKSNISNTVRFGDKVTKEHKLEAIHVYRMVPLSMTLSDHDFKITIFFDIE